MAALRQETIDITPHQSLMPKLGSAGYTAPQAIAELVDNSIDARLGDQPLVVSIKISREEIVVADNASGMDKRTVSQAMVLASSSKRGQLGHFGLGLKTACCSLGKAFEIQTSARGSSEEYHVSFDEDRWLSQRQHWKIDVGISPVEPEQHYTIIRVTRLRVRYPALKELVRTDLSRRYSPFIANGEVVIKVNGKPCAIEKFDLIEGTRKEFEIADSDGNRIYGWYALLKQGSARGHYGFHTYRLGRMITTFDKIGIREHPTLCRIIGEVHLDHVPVTHNKREFLKDSDAYRRAEAALRKEYEALVRLARQRASEDSITKTVRVEIEQWKDTIARVLQDREFRSVTDFLVGPAEPRLDPAGQPEPMPVEVRERPTEDEATPPESAPEMPPPQPPEPRKRHPEKTHEDLRHCIRIRGKKIDFQHTFAPLGEDAPWKQWHFDPAKGLDIFTNIEFPAYAVTRDKSFYAVIHIAEAIAEFWARETGEPTVRAEEIREQILRRASRAREEWVGAEERVPPP